jgi:hypothetical protein
MCGTSQKAGHFAVQRKTIGKRMAANGEWALSD